MVSKLKYLNILIYKWLYEYEIINKFIQFSVIIIKKIFFSFFFFLTEKIFKSSNKLLCYYKNIPNHPYYMEEIGLPYQISVIFTNVNIGEKNADKLLNTVIASKLVNVPIENPETPTHIDDTSSLDNISSTDDFNGSLQSKYKNLIYYINFMY